MAPPRLGQAGGGLNDEGLYTARPNLPVSCYANQLGQLGQLGQRYQRFHGTVVFAGHDDDGSELAAGCDMWTEHIRLGARSSATARPQRRTVTLSAAPTTMTRTTHATTTE